MRKPDAVIFTAWALHLASWFLPVLKANDVHRAVPGWRAFRYSACAVWPCKGIEFDTLYHAVLVTISVLTTLFFIVCSLWVTLHGLRSLRRPFAWAAAAAFAFNTHWIVIFGDDRSDLTIGYFLWWSSFLLLAIALFMRDEKRPVIPETLAQNRVA